MDYSNFLLMTEELSLMAVMLFLLIYDIFSGEKGKQFFQPIALILFTLHIGLNCIPRDAFDAFGGMYHYTPITTWVKTILSIGTLLVLLQSSNWLKGESQ